MKNKYIIFLLFSLNSTLFAQGWRLKGDKISAGIGLMGTLSVNKLNLYFEDNKTLLESSKWPSYNLYLNTFMNFNGLTCDLNYSPGKNYTLAKIGYNFEINKMFGLGINLCHLGRRKSWINNQYWENMSYIKHPVYTNDTNTNISSRSISANIDIRIKIMDNVQLKLSYNVINLNKIEYVIKNYKKLYSPSGYYYGNSQYTEIQPVQLTVSWLFGGNSVGNIIYDKSSGDKINFLK